MKTKVVSNKMTTKGIQRKNAKWERTGKNKKGDAKARVVFSFSLHLSECPHCLSRLQTLRYDHEKSQRKNVSQCSGCRRGTSPCKKSGENRQTVRNINKHSMMVEQRREVEQR